MLNYFSAGYKAARSSFACFSLASRSSSVIKTQAVFCVVKPLANHIRVDPPPVSSIYFLVVVDVATATALRRHRLAEPPRRHGDNGNSSP